MVRARKAKQESAQPTEAPGLDVNAVVSYNVKAIRERRGMTQQQVADRLAVLTGHQLPQASISAMERGFDGERRRRFDAHELYLLSVVFDVPVTYFLGLPASMWVESWIRGPAFVGKDVLDRADREHDQGQGRLR
jgi:transcriptional regulator with XRE-family HTH domain